MSEQDHERISESSAHARQHPGAHFVAQGILLDHHEANRTAAWLRVSMDQHFRDIAYADRVDAALTQLGAKSRTSPLLVRHDDDSGG